MGREIRKVPATWGVTREERDDAHPMYDETFEQACAEWDADKARWDSGDDPDRSQYKKDDGSDYTWEEWTDARPDDPAYYRPWKDEEATHYQLWQNVSEGHAISPPFETPEELVEYLTTEGDDWNKLWSRHAVESLLSSGYAPSFVMIAGQTYAPHQGFPSPVTKEEATVHSKGEIE